MLPRGEGTSRLGEAETQAYNAGWDTASAQLGNPDAIHHRSPQGFLSVYYVRGYNDCVAFYQQHKGGNTYER